MLYIPTSSDNGGKTTGGNIGKTMVASQHEKPNSNSSAISKPTMTCFYCHKAGHKIRDCWKKKNAANKADKAENTAATERDKKGKGAADKALTVSVPGSGGTTVSAVCSLPQWKLDICATTHMCNDIGQSAPYQRQMAL